MPVFEAELEHIDVDKEIEELKLHPVFSRIVVKEVEVQKVGSLYVPETSKDGELQTNEGYVLAVGEDVERFKPKDHIYYGRYSGFWCRIGGKKYRVMNEEDVIGVIEDAERV